ncbi:MAG: hypothetical protein JSS22_14380 [Proteobacteria bacterium]|nr:hypothetical protein [Pseudomonadota bacterium]
MGSVIFNQFAAVQQMARGGNRAARLTFMAGNRLLVWALQRTSGANQGSCPMTFVGNMSVVTAYVALAFVGAIVLGFI